jgi:Mn2+/Fe2+ NRAMP family transporter
VTETQRSASKPVPERKKSGIGRAVGLGVITGAAADDPSAIGTYASAGAKLGLSFLWTAPVTLPMMYAVVYLSAKLGQVSGRGLFRAIKDYYPRRVLYPTLIGVLIGNTIEAGADLGGMAAALNLFIPIPIPWLVVAIAIVILAVQLYGSYIPIRNVFRWLALVLLAYVGAAVLAKPDLGEVLRGTFIPTIEFNRDFLTMMVAVIGTTGWRHSLHSKPREAKKFYASIIGFTVIGVAMNFLGFNPMKALVWAGVVQGFSTPPLLLLIMLMTNNRTIMGDKVNGRAINILGSITTAAIFAASAGLVASWFI